MKVKFKTIEKQKWVKFKVYVFIPAKKDKFMSKTDAIYDMQSFDNITDAISYSKGLIQKYSGVPNAEFILVKDINIMDTYHVSRSEKEE